MLAICYVVCRFALLPFALSLLVVVGLGCELLCRL